MAVDTARPSEAIEDYAKAIYALQRRSADGVGGRHEAVMCRLRNQHQAARDVPRYEDVRRRRPEIGIDAYVATPIGLDACGHQIQPGGVGHPAHGDDGERGLSAVPCAILREDLDSQTPRGAG